jgi:histidine triad (HIT) family protein
MDCIFCDIIQRKSPAEIIYEDEKVISFLDIRPINYGHTLVIPIKHYEDFISVPSDEMNAIINVTQNISEAVSKSLKADGFNIIANNGAAAGQRVFHFHFHIIPRYNTDKFHFRPILKNYSNGSMKEIADKIRSAVTK